MCRSCDWQQFVEDAEELLGRLDDLPSRAEDFAEGVREKTTGMLEWARENEHVTDRMTTALDNMIEGVSRWER